MRFLTTNWSNRPAQGFSPGLRVKKTCPCLSAVVLGMRDEGGKVAPELGRSVELVRSITQSFLRLTFPRSTYETGPPVLAAKNTSFS